MDKLRFTYPFCYEPREEILQAADRMIARISSDPSLRPLFSEGKMLGVLEVSDDAGGVDFLYAFSGNAGGRSMVEGFVPPVFDLMDPLGHYKKEEAVISDLNRRIIHSSDRAEVDELKKLRHSKSIALQDWIFEQYVVHNANGQALTIKEVFSRIGSVPPGGTGDCAAPKLLEYAYRNNLHPLAMGEFWYGASPLKEIRHQGIFYPSCMGKCGPLLSFMMEGLEVEPNPLDAPFSFETDPAILYEDNAIIVVNKPSGMLSVPGKTDKVSLLEWLRRTKGSEEIYSCHRLDMDTAGLIVFARSVGIKADMERQFQKREVHKTYLARLVPPSPAMKNTRSMRPGSKGTIALPLMPDYYDRPRQMVDFEDGKRAVTEYEILRALPDGSVEVRFSPQTGRTHQLRVHSAHPQGLGRPILGDRLYGGGSGRLHLTADSISFRHPVSGESVRFVLP